MTKEELLLPRFECINTKGSDVHYPGSPFTVGEIIVLDEICNRGPKKGVFTQITFENYDNLFRKLKWWQERNEKDLPDYLQNIKTGKVSKVDKYDFDSNTITLDGGYKFTLIMMLVVCVPITKEEYENGTKQDIIYDK